MDLIFDVQVLRYRREERELPEAVLASIAGYYRRATTTSRPMSLLIVLVMLVTLTASVVRLAGSPERRLTALASLATAGVPIVLALARIVPNAVRLGTRRDTATEQSRLARSICREHLFCLAAVAVFLALQFA